LLSRKIGLNVILITECFWCQSKFGRIS
jgi:hypothetical protein